VLRPQAIHDIEIPLTNSRYFDIKNANTRVASRELLLTILGITQKMEDCN
jgi:hypothetical protein